MFVTNFSLMQKDVGRQYFTRKCVSHEMEHETRLENIIEAALEHGNTLEKHSVTRVIL